MPNRISQYHWVDLYSDNGYEWLLKALLLRANSIGAVFEFANNKIASHKTYTNKNKSISSEQLSSKSITDETPKKFNSGSLPTNRNLVTLSGNLWGIWIGVTILGLALGAATVLLLQNNPWIDPYSYTSVGYGLMFGFGQWLIIRKYLSFSIWWILLSAIVSALGVPFASQLGDNGFGFIGFWCIASFILGIVIMQKKEVA